MAVPTVKFNNGKEIPILGLGTWKSKPGEVCDAVKWAIDAGYRHIDCALVYGNEPEVGEAIAAKIAEGVVKREDLFITSKLWNSYHRPDLVSKGLSQTLKDLRLDYLDLYLVHWPFAFKEEGDNFPVEADGSVAFSDVDYLVTWKEMEKAVTSGKVLSIGISNFNKDQTQRLLDNCTIKPVTNQVECHPWLNQNALKEYSESKGIVLTAYSPLGSPDRPFAKPDDPVLLEEPVIKKIADKYGKGPGHVLIRYQIQRGIPVIPKSVNQQRIQSNFNVFDFELTKEDIAAIQGLEKGNVAGRCVPYIDAKAHKYWPFHAEF